MSVISGSSEQSIGCRKHYNELYAPFSESLESCRGGRFIDLMDFFSLNCNEFVSQCKDSGASDKDILWAEQERDTWRLMYHLYESRFRKKPCGIGERDEIIDDKTVVEEFYERDEVARECQLVVHWLENVASGKYSSGICVPPDRENAVAWQSTLYELKFPKVSQMNKIQSIQEFDPDAPLRTGKRITDEDEQEETDLSRQIFLKVRSGEVDEAVRACKIFGYDWLAVALSGWYFHYDPNYDKDDDDTVLDIEGGEKNRHIWKKCTWMHTQVPNLVPHWKATLGALCGSILAVLPVCETWEDYLWAYLKVLIEVRVERELVTVHPDMDILPREYWDYRLSLEDIFKELDGNSNDNVREESLHPVRLVQKFLILKQIPELISAIVEWCSDETVSSQIIRLSVHVVLCLRIMDIEHDYEQANLIIRRFIQDLVKNGHSELVAHYVSFLPVDERVDAYTNFILNLPEPEEERLGTDLVEKALHHDLDIDAITFRIARSIRQENVLEDFSVTNETVVDKKDLKKIETLKWILHYPHQRTDALYECNALVRYFLACGKKNAAILAFQKIPRDSIRVIADSYELNQKPLIGELSPVPLKYQAAINEFLCYDLYLKAIDAFSEWYHAFHANKPLMPNQLPTSASFTERVAYQHDVARYEANYENWKRGILHQSEAVKTQLYNILLFPRGGWLVETTYTEDANRMEELEILRKIYIPLVTSYLQTLFIDMGEYQECIKIADVIADESRRLYTAFSKESMAKTLKRIADASVCLLKAGKDPWGLPLAS